MTAIFILVCKKIGLQQNLRGSGAACSLEFATLNCKCRNFNKIKEIHR